MEMDDVVRFLRSCSGRELATVMSQVGPHRGEAKVCNGMVEKLVLCLAHRLEDQSSSHFDGWHFEPIGVADPDGPYCESEGSPFLEAGFCPDCRVTIASHVKVAICPLCGMSISCT